MKRRSMLAFISAPAAAAVPRRAARAEATSAAAEAVPVTGEPSPDLAPIDRFMIAFMQKWSIPGGQCAVAKDGRLVHARGRPILEAAQEEEP